MLVVNNVSKKYGEMYANKDVSFTAKEQEVTILLGANGAGKSTIIKSIVGLLRFDGEITLDDVAISELSAKKQIAYVPEMPELYNELSVWEHFRFIAHVNGITDFEETALKYLDVFNLSHKKDTVCSDLSKGMRQKVSIINALITKPKLLILDEPMIGLDPEAIRTLRQVLDDLKQDCIVFLSTHLIESVETIWDHAIILRNGSVVFEGDKKDLVLQSVRLEDIYFDVKGGE